MTIDSINLITQLSVGPIKVGTYFVITVQCLSLHYPSKTNPFYLLFYECLSWKKKKLDGKLN